MTESTSSHHRHGSHSGEGFFNSDLYRTRLRPILQLALTVLLPVMAKFFHAGLLVALAGLSCILITMISKYLKLQSGILVSMMALLLMVMLNIWHWADQYFISVISGDILAEKSLFRSGLVEGSIVPVVIWLYRRLLKSLNMRITHEWFVRKSQLKFLKVLLLAQIFLLAFWIACFFVHSYKSGGRYDTHEATLIAFIITMIFAGIPILFYLLKTWNSQGSSSHRHRRHHHHHHPERTE